MKTTFLLLLAAATTLHAQGLLTPPGAPAPSMKTLDQIDPRTDVATLINGSNPMFKLAITQPGSYYLTGNLDISEPIGIWISASGVTLDLMGFNLFRSSDAAAYGSAISVREATNVVIKNGNITGGVTYNATSFTGSGFENGVATLPNAKNIRVSHVHVSGCSGEGIDLDSGSFSPSNTVRNCKVSFVGGDGISAGSISESLVYYAGGVGIRANGNVISSRAITAGPFDAINSVGNVSDSYGQSLGTSAFGNDGIRAANVSNSHGKTSGGDSNFNSGSEGINATYCVENSTGITAGAVGIRASLVNNGHGTSTGGTTWSAGITAAFSVKNSYGLSTNSDGIQARNVSNSYGQTSGAGDGIDAAETVISSTGYSSGAGGRDGIQAHIIGYSYADSNGTASGADGVQGTIVVGCRVFGGESIVNKYLMP